MSRLGGAVLAGVLAGGLHALSLRLPWGSVLAWVALVPLLAVAAKEDRTRTIAATIAYALTLGQADVTPWLAPAIARYFALGPRTAAALAIGGMTLLAAGYGALLAAALVRRRRVGPRLGIVWCAATWSIWEALRTVVPPFLAAGTLGLSQIDVPPVLQLASVTGIAGVTALVVAANAALVGVVDHALARTRRAAGVAGVAALVVVAATWGHRRIAAAPGAAGASGALVLVDGAARTVAESTLDRYVDATPRTLDPPPALVVWPESALDVDLERDRPTWLRLAAFVDGLGVPLVTGGIATALDAGGKPMRFNAVHYVRPRHGVESYYKRRLMPLAEAWPVALGAPPSVLAPVTAGRELALFGDGAGRFGPLICSEITDGAAARGLVRRGARFLVSVNNDVWFADREAPHVVWARVRAVETGVSVARASNRGTSGVIDPFGGWAARRGASAAGWMQAELSPPVPARYVRTGDWFLPLCAVVVLVGLGRWRRST